MFCPLCQSEYRDTFTECSDCHIALVASQEEAATSSVQLWRGTSDNAAYRIIEPLEDAGIPAHFKPIVSFQPVVTFLGMRIAGPKSNFECEVWVLRRDLDRAEALIGDKLC